MTITDPVDQLAEHAPVLRSDLDHLFPDLAARPRTVRRRLLLVAAAAALTTGLVALPLVVPLSAADAAAVDRLSSTAGRQPAQTPSGVLHQVTQDWQEGFDGLRILESWTMPDGSSWRRDVGHDGSVNYHHFDTISWLSPQEMALLPTDPKRLDAVVRSRVQGSMSTDEAVFTFYGDALRMGYVPASVRQAMVTAMGRLPHLGVQRATTVDGRACLKITYTEPARFFMAGKFYCFVEATSAMIEEGETYVGKLSFRSTLTTYEYVAAVPESVKAGAAQQPAKEASAQPGTETPTSERTPR